MLSFVLENTAVKVKDAASLRATNRRRQAYLTRPPTSGRLALMKSGAFTLPRSLVRKRVRRTAPP